MSADENETVARSRAQATFVQHDQDAAAQFVAANWVGHWAGVGDGHGIEGFKRLAGAYLQAFPDIQISVEDALSSRTVTAAWRGAPVSAGPVDVN